MGDGIVAPYFVKARHKRSFEYKVRPGQLN